MANPSSTPTPQQAASLNRLAYQQRIDQLKAVITELGHRNMENALRVLRSWLAEGKK